MKVIVKKQYFIFLFIITLFFSCLFFVLSNDNIKKAYANNGEFSEEEKNLLDIKKQIKENGHQYQRVYNENGYVDTYESQISDEFVDYFSSKIITKISEKCETKGRDIINPFTTTTIVDSGLPDSESVVIVFMGDGYTAGVGANQQGSWPNPVEGSFLGQAKKAAENLLNTYPFDQFSHLFKIYAVQVISNEYGISKAPDGTGAVYDTYFGCYFESSSYIKMPAANRTIALDIAESVSDNVSMIQVLANTNAHGGVTYLASYSDYNTVNLTIVATQLGSNYYWSPKWCGTVVHEFGHSFGQLVDEYDGAGCLNESRANLTQVSDYTLVKWSHWIGYENITVRKITGDWYVPSPYNSCIMRASWAYSKFCAVCAAELTRRLAIISNEVFYGKHTNSGPDPNITNVVMSSTTDRILPMAFNGNTYIQNVTISASVETIGDYAFIGATGLTTIINECIIPQEINSTTFAGLTRSNITVAVPPNTTQAYREAGWTDFIIIEHSWLTTNNSTGATVLGCLYPLSGDVIVPQTINNSIVTQIGTSAFISNTQISSITLPDSVVSIGANAFYGCTGLTSINIPQYVSSIGQEAFANCSGLTSITVSASNTIYKAEGNCLIRRSDNMLISGCKTSVIPQTVTSIGDYAFKGYTALTSINIPSSVTSIGDEAFKGCTALERVHIDHSDHGITLGGNAFYSTPSNLTILVPYNLRLLYTFSGDWSGYLTKICYYEMYNNQMYQTYIVNFWQPDDYFTVTYYTDHIIIEMININSSDPGTIIDCCASFYVNTTDEFCVIWSGAYLPEYCYTVNGWVIVPYCNEIGGYIEEFVIFPDDYGTMPYISIYDMLFTIAYRGSIIT